MSHPRRPMLTLAIAALVSAGCESTFNMAGQPAVAPLGQEAAVRAILATGAGGTFVTIDNPRALPAAVQAAGKLEVAIGSTKIPVTRNPGGYYTFSVPASASMSPDVSGNWKVVFVLDERASQIVTLQTGSPVQFANPPVLTDPSPGFIVRGLEVKLRANTDASTEKYQFTWAYATSANGPWQPIPGQGKEVEWTPPAQGNYVIKVDAVDRTTQQSYSTTTPAALVFVTDGDEVITTTPANGSVDRGQPVTLVFNRPQGLRGDDLSYSWSVGPSGQGPWTLVQGSGTSIQWLPTTVGSYFVKTEVSSRTTGEVNTFVSPEAVVFVNEGKPIVTANPSTVLRGDRVNLSVNLPVQQGALVSWFYSRTGAGPTATWTPLVGNGQTNGFLVNEAGSYSFRVDMPDAQGAIKTFTTTDPVLNVSEGDVPLITSEPRNAIVKQGAIVTLKLNARGVDDSNFRYTWFIATTPGAWRALPIDNAREATVPTFDWDTEPRIEVADDVFRVNPESPGAYFVRVDAAERNGPAVYTFTSSTPVVTILQR